MHNPELLYKVDEDLAATVSEVPVMLHLMQGFIDAGGAGQVAADHLRAHFGGQRLITFDIDELLDYRSRRPAMTFDSNTWLDYESPSLVVDLLHDRGGRPFLLLHGFEPDIRWEAWIGAVHEVVERFKVRLVVGVNGIPMGVPHTRPLGFTAHANRLELVKGQPSWFGAAKVPASASALLEHRLGAWGHDAMGFAIHVPHYLAQTGYPQAAMTGLEQIERVTGLSLASGALEVPAKEATLEIERQVADSSEVRTMIHSLEEDYDTSMETVGRMGPFGNLPSADEIGDELERFLADQGREEL